jgi:hypothetical protein
MPSRLRSPFLLLLAALAALVLSACGGDGDGDAASSSTDVNTLLKQTFTGKKKVDSGRLDLKLAIDAKGGEQSGPIDLKLSGPFQSQGERKVPKFELDLAFNGGGQNITGGVTSTGDKGFVNFNNQDYAVSDSVFRQLRAGYEEAQKRAASGSKSGRTPSLASLGIDPRKWLTDPKNAGEAKVGDADTIRITGGVSVPKLLDDVDVALGKAGSLGLQNAGQLPQKLTEEQRRQVTESVRNLRVEIFTGKEDKTLRRMVVALELRPKAGNSAGVQSATLKLDFSLLELNEEQEIAAPKSTKPLDELLGQFGGLAVRSADPADPADPVRAAPAPPISRSSRSTRTASPRPVPTRPRRRSAPSCSSPSRRLRRASSGQDQLAVRPEPGGVEVRLGELGGQLGAAQRRALLPRSARVVQSDRRPAAPADPATFVDGDLYQGRHAQQAGGREGVVAREVPRRVDDR